MCGFSIILILKGIMTFSVQRSPCFLLNKNINFNKSEAQLNMENPTNTFLERRTLCFSCYSNLKLKVKL